MKQKKKIKIWKLTGILLVLLLLISGCSDAVTSDQGGSEAYESELVSELSQQAEPDTSDEITSDITEIQDAETQTQAAEDTADVQIESVSPQTTDSTLEVHYIDVGQGDATLITCDGAAMLIDAGNNNKGTLVQSYLTSQGVETLDYVIGTHPDADHIGGLDVIITKFDCGTIFLTDDSKDTATYRDVLSAISYRNYKKTNPVVGDTYKLGDAEFTFIAPVSLVSDANENSIAFVLTHGENRFYFEGDAETLEEADIVAGAIDVSADVYKVGHHGSRTSSSDALLEKVSPAYAVISVGDNSYGHPSAETLNKLRASGVQVFRTDEQGSVIATSDGSSITWNSAPSDSWQAGEPTGGSSDEDASNSGSTSTGATSSSSALAAGGDASATVHITESGTKYHSAGCQYLSKSDIEVTLETAKSNGLSPCAKCNPPQ